MKVENVKLEKRGIKPSDIVALTFAGILIAIIVFQCISPTLVSGTSMLPTIEDGDYLFMEKVGTPKKNDIIVFNSNYYEDTILIKRVVAEPGDKLIIKDSNIYINDKLIDEPYILEKDFECDNYELVIPEGKYFVMGDNRNNSLDSRAIGLVDKEDIIGTILLRVYPFDKMGNL